MTTTSSLLVCAEHIEEEGDFRFSHGKRHSLSLFELFSTLGFESVTMTFPVRITLCWDDLVAMRFVLEISRRELVVVSNYPHIATACERAIAKIERGQCPAPSELRQALEIYKRVSNASLIRGLGNLFCSDLFLVQTGRVRVCEFLSRLLVLKNSIHASNRRRKNQAISQSSWVSSARENVFEYRSLFESALLGEL